MGDTDSEMRNN